jgi:SAM-dependent methyltransferase
LTNCRACNGKSLYPFYTFTGLPRNIQYLPPSCDQGHEPTDLTVLQCKQCGLIQAEMTLQDDYYHDYLMSQTFSPRLAKYLDALAEKFIADHNLQNRTVLDVGCGDGAFMIPFAHRGIKVHGIEPSDRARALAAAQGFTVFSGYMWDSDDCVLAAAPYDAFVSRQVLEHVPDIHGFLAGIRRNLVEGAVGLIEVPRLETAINNRRFYDFFPDHVNYFDLDTLGRTLSIHGFEVLDLYTGMDHEYNIAEVRLRSTGTGQALQHCRDNLCQDIISTAEHLRATSQGPVAVWGAGAKGLVILSSLPGGTVDLVVDSDTNKIGRYTPISKFQVQRPEQLVAQGASAVIITAVAYQETIINHLLSMNFAGKVLVIDQDRLREP